MRELTIFEVIRALPIAEETKKELLNKYDTYDDAIKFEIIHTCWDAFDDMMDIIKAAKQEEFTAEVTEGKRQFGDNFTNEVEKAAWEEMEGYISGKKVEKEAIEDIRKQLQNLMTTAASK